MPENIFCFRIENYSGFIKIHITSLVLAPIFLFISIRFLKKNYFLLCNNSILFL